MSRKNIYFFSVFKYSGIDGLSVNNKSVHLAKTPAKLLHLLVFAENSPVTKETILTTLWPNEAASETALDRCVYLLRKTLSDYVSGEIIRNEYGYGYRIVPSITATGAEEERPGLLSGQTADTFRAMYRNSGVINLGINYALQLFSNLTLISPKDPHLLSLMADFTAVRIIRGHLSARTGLKSIRSCTARALQFDPHCASAMATSAWASAVIEGRHGEGLRLVERAVMINPESGLIRCYHAWCLAANGLLEQAIERALDISGPDNFERDNIAIALWLLMCLGEYQRFEVLAKRALNISPKFDFLYAIVAVYHGMRGNFALAIQLCEQALGKGGKERVPLSALGYIRAFSGDVQGAHGVLRDLDSQNSAATTPALLAPIYQALKMPDQVAAVLQRAQDSLDPWRIFTPFDPRLTR